MEVSWAVRIQSSVASSSISGRVPVPPGTMITSGWRSSSSRASATIDSMPLSVLYGPVSFAMKVTRESGRRESTSYGPIASSAVNLSKIGIAMSICVSFSMRLAAFCERHEAFSVTGRPDPEPSVKGAPHRLDGAEAAAPGDRLDGLLRAVQGDAGGLDAGGLDVHGRRHADLLAEGAREVARAHAGPFGERRHGEVRVEVVRDPGLELTQRLPLGDLSGKLGAELRLTARPFEEQHEPARHLERRARGRGPPRRARG